MAVLHFISTGRETLITAARDQLTAGASLICMDCICSIGSELFSCRCRANV